MHTTWRGARALMLLLVSIGGLGCTDTPASTETNRVRLADGVSAADSARLLTTANPSSRPDFSVAENGDAPCILFFLSPGVVEGCGENAPQVTPMSPYLEHSGAARDVGEVEYRGDIVIDFASPRTGFSVSSSGALKCTGTAMRLIGFRKGVQVFSEAAAPIDPSDCGEDDVTFGIQVASPANISADRIVLVGPLPWTFDIDGATGRARLRYTVQYAPQVQQQALEATCTPTTVERGQSVRCTARLAIPVPFRITERFAEGEQRIRVQDLTVVSVASGAELVWEGPMAVPTEVRFVAEVEEAGRVSRYTSQKVRVAVTPRSWPTWQYGRVEQLFLVYGPGMTPYPLPGTRLGLFQPEPPDEASTGALIARINAGPNQGAAYLERPYRLEAFVVGIHPALDLGAFSPDNAGYQGSLQWANDQNAIPSGTCAQSAIEVLLREVERHEGITLASNSHPGVGNRIFAMTQPQQLLEELATLKTDAEFIRVIASTVSKVLNGNPYRQAQDSFDKNDYPLLFGAAGCVYDFNPTNP